MKPKTEEFLYFLMWAAELLARPTYRNITGSYESWAYSKGLLRQAATLERLGMVEQAPANKGDRLFRLTDLGRIHALGGRDPAKQWARAWDGRWRLVLFDVPMEHNKQRDRLRRILSGQFLGCLQGSVWVSPEPVEQIRELLAGGTVNVKSLILFEGIPQGGENASQIVQGAWDFEEINQAYAEHIDILGHRPRARLGSASAAQVLRDWSANERQAWLDAVSQDPLLPKALHPPGYLGPTALRKRVQILAEAGKQIRTFQI